MELLAEVDRRRIAVPVLASMAQCAHTGDICSLSVSGVIQNAINHIYLYPVRISL